MGIADLNVSTHGKRKAARDVEAKAATARITPAEPFELLEDALSTIFWDTCSLIHDSDPGSSVIDASLYPHFAILRRVAHGVADQVHQDLQCAPKFSRRDGLMFRFWWEKLDLAAHRLDHKQPCGPSPNIGQVHILGRNGEVQPVDRLQVRQIIDQRHQMTSGCRDVGSITRIVRAQRPIELRVDRIRIGDDPAQWLAQGTIQAPPELCRIYDNGGRRRHMRGQNGSVQWKCLAR